MIVTTSILPSDRLLALAARMAQELHAKLTTRGNLSVKKLMASSEDQKLIVVTEHEVRYYYRHTTHPFYFHPSMAFVRVKRLRQGEPDPLIVLSGCEEGDRIIDCTAGLASDSLVFSYAAGSSGSVTALKK